MNEQTQSMLSVRARGCRVRVLAAVFSVGLLLSVAACGGGGSSGDSGDRLPSGDDSAGGTVMDTVSLLKVCDLVDLEPLATTLTSPGYEFGPEDVPMGTGVDPGGPQCAAQLKLPQLTSVAGNKEDLVPARLNVAVVAYDDVAGATAQFDKRIGESEAFEGSKSEELDGSWTRGTIVTVEGEADELVHGLVQKDTYLVKIHLQVSSDVNYREQFAFTVDDVGAAVAEVMGSLCSAVSAEIDG